VLAATVAAGALLMTPAIPVPGPDLLSLGFQVINVNSRMCLAADPGGPGAEQRGCDRSDAVRWRIRPASLTGRIELVHHASGRCLSAAGDDVVLATCADRPSGRWQLIDSDGPTAQLRSGSTGRCLTIAAGSRAAGAAAVSSTCDDRRSRRWTVRVIAAPFLN
jgi:hypothetical protein